MESIVLLNPLKVFVLYAVDLETLASLVSAYMRAYGFKALDVSYLGQVFRVTL